MKKIYLLIFFTLVVLSNFGWAAMGEPLELQTRYGHYYTTYVINEDGTAIETREWSMTVLKGSALEWSKSTSISHSTSAQKAEVIAAYIKKADGGKRIDVPKNNYQVEVNRGIGKDSPIYSDQTKMTVVFPDVAVGDTIFFSYRLIQTEPLFPKHFSAAETFYDQMAFDDVRVRFEYPASLWVQYEARQMQEKENRERDRRKVIEWTYTNPKPVKNERRNFSVYDPEKSAGYAFSTFKSYADIVAAYGARAVPKAAVTDRIQKLAAEIVKDKTNQKEQARALYEWVATNITYAGNCIGIGAVVPRDVSFVIDNKMGDCKDHATLLQALLAARGISSAQALVNAGSVYRLPKIPVVSTVNHVITYIPSLDLYVDSTSGSTPFGVLPFADQDKPILLVQGFKDGLKTPATSVGRNQQIMKSIMKIASDGSTSGTVEVFQNGETAVQIRAWARKLTREYEEDLVKNIFRAQNKIASGKLEKDDPTALADSYRYKLSFNVEKFIKLPGAGAFYIYPATGSGSIQSLLAYSTEVEKEADVTCLSGTATEEYVIELPKTMKIFSIPDDLKISNNVVFYTASYKLNKNVLTVKRMIYDRTKGNVCSPQTMAENKKIVDKVLDNLKEQVLYK